MRRLIYIYIYIYIYMYIYIFRSLMDMAPLSAALAARSELSRPENFDVESFRWVSFDTVLGLF